MEEVEVYTILVDMEDTVYMVGMVSFSLTFYFHIHLFIFCYVILEEEVTKLITVKV